MSLSSRERNRIILRINSDEPLFEGASEEAKEYYDSLMAEKAKMEAENKAKGIDCPVIFDCVELDW